MIEQETVFILGAGASVPYGYPTGEELRKRICGSYCSSIYGGSRISSEYFSYLKKEGKIDDEEVIKRSNFMETFYYSSNPSIDLFLSRNTKFAQTGKIAIAVEILACEAESRFRELIELTDTTEIAEIRKRSSLFSHEDLIVYEKKRNRASQDWYSHLFHRMTEELIQGNDYEKFSENKVSFITFNYDRSLEYFLYESLRHTFSEVPEDKIKNQMVKMIEEEKRFIHVYGQVAKLEWQDKDNGIPYLYLRDKNEAFKLDIGKLSKEINLMNELKDNPKPELKEKLEKVKEIISNAKRIFFLGFGYAPGNLEILGIPDIISANTNIYGTALGSTEKERKDILNKFGSIVGGTDEYPNRYDIKMKEKPIILFITIRDMDCVQLLRENL